MTNIPDWSLAECQGLTNLFFTDPGEPAEPAREVCRACPIRDACLEYALDNYELFGVWGGLSFDERKPLLRGRGRRLRPFEHGTDAGYVTELRRGLTPCDACRVAHARVNREKKQRKKERELCQ